MRWGISWDMFGKKHILKYVSMKIPDDKTTGIESRCQDGKHIIFFDYDKIDYDFLIDSELPMLQDQFELSDIYVFDSGRTKNLMRGYHAICLDKFPIGDVYYILKHSSCEWAFIEAPRLFNEYKSWILRTIEKSERQKPIYIETVTSIFNKYEQSLFHAMFLKAHYDVPVIAKNLDKYTEGYETHYKTYSKKPIQTVVK